VTERLRKLAMYALLAAGLSGIATGSRAEGPEGAHQDSGDCEAENCSGASGDGSDVESIHPKFRKSARQVREAPVTFSSELESIDRESAKRYLKELCPETPVSMELKGRDKPVWACRTCPGFTSLPEAEGPLVLEERIRGSFFEEGHRDDFVTYRGCEPSNAAYGGAVIFRKQSGSWEPFYRHPGLHPQACLKFSAESHPDRLACRLRYVSEDRVVEKIVDAATRQGAAKMVRSIDNSARCPTKKFISSYLYSWKREDVNADGRADLVIEKVQRHEPLGDENEDPVCSLEDSDGIWDRARKMFIELRFSGRRFHMHNRRYEPLPAAARRADNYAEAGEESGDDGERSEAVDATSGERRAVMGVDGE